MLCFIVADAHVMVRWNADWLLPRLTVTTGYFVGLVVNQCFASGGIFFVRNSFPTARSQGLLRGSGPPDRNSTVGHGFRAESEFFPGVTVVKPIHRTLHSHRVPVEMISSLPNQQRAHPSPVAMSDHRVFAEGICRRSISHRAA